MRAGGHLLIEPTDCRSFLLAPPIGSSIPKSIQGVLPMWFQKSLIQICLVSGLCFAMPFSLLADFQYTETTKITGGSLVSMMKFAGAFSKEARQATDPGT